MADTSVIEYFSFLHDSRRINEDSGPDHRKRAAEFAFSLRDSYVDLSDTSFSLLVTTACEGHTHEQHHDDVTVQPIEMLTGSTLAGSGSYLSQLAWVPTEG